MEYKIFLRFIPVAVPSRVSLNEPIAPAAVDVVFVIKRPLDSDFRPIGSLFDMAMHH